jgi:hypothetical protein
MDKTLEQLKAEAYDLMVIIERTQLRLRELNQEIAKRQQEK